jgi:hypothetical protein
MLNHMHDFHRMILSLAFGVCLFGITGSSYGQQPSQAFGGLHPAAQLHPSRFVYGTEAFARTISPPARPSAVLVSPNNIPQAYTPTSQGIPMGTNPSILGEVNNIGIAPSNANATRGEPQPREDLQQIISRSSTLSERDAIRVLSNGSEAILRGTVTSDYDLRLAEAMLLLSPQVQTVRNELTVGQ